VGVDGFDLSRFKQHHGPINQYEHQLNRLRAENKQADCIDQAVAGAMESLAGDGRSAFVIYGEPQSGKTEMMICLTAKLLDAGRNFILHLLNDSVDLLGQNLGRFQKSGLAPAAKNFTDILDPDIKVRGRTHVVFCKKNPRDLERVIDKVGRLGDIVIIDDEADYASPNAKVNRQEKTRINELITQLLGERGDYIGVTATPARLDLNNTFENDSALWVDFPPHGRYTGQDSFFPLSAISGEQLPFRCTLLPPHIDSPKYGRHAFLCFLVTAAHLNLHENPVEQNYSMLIHTSGKKADHKADWAWLHAVIDGLSEQSSKAFDALVTELWSIAAERFGAEQADELVMYVLTNISRHATFVLNSDRDFVQNGLSATNPSALFTVIIGGNIVSRGVTFDNLLAMYFTRDVKHKIQQDTYIQRARMFGSRGAFLRHFELTIPAHLYWDWHRCFVFHRLALTAIKERRGSPVWLGDNRIAVAAASSIDNATVDMNRGEMSFRAFQWTDDYDSIASKDGPVIGRLQELAELTGGEALPSYLLKYIAATSQEPSSQIALHTSTIIDGYSDAQGLDKERIERSKGFFGANQLERSRFPDAIHHVKVFRNQALGIGRFFYKFDGSVSFIQNRRQ
jgi:hypothetical protein